MLKRACVIGLLALSVVLDSCGAAVRQEPPNLTPVQHAAFVADPYTMALSDFQDGVIADHQAGWLSTKDTKVALDALQVAFTAIEASADARRDPLAPGGAKAIALAALRDLQTRVSAKLAPYIASALKVMGGA